MQTSKLLGFGNRKMPALERNILRYRALHLTLLNFHIEEFKRKIVFMTKESNDKKALKALMKDNFFTEREEKEIKRLINFRNHAAHEIYRIFSDLSQDYFTKKN